MKRVIRFAYDRRGFPISLPFHFFYRAGALLPAQPCLSACTDNYSWSLSWNQAPTYFLAPLTDVISIITESSGGFSWPVLDTGDFETNATPRLHPRPDSPLGKGKLADSERSARFDSECEMARWRQDGILAHASQNRRVKIQDGSAQPYWPRECSRRAGDGGAA
jgi:hypothetical protein